MEPHSCHIQLQRVRWEVPWVSFPCSSSAWSWSFSFLFPKTSLERLALRCVEFRGVICYFGRKLGVESVAYRDQSCYAMSIYQRILVYWYWYSRRDRDVSVWSHVSTNRLLTLHYNVKNNQVRLLDKQRTSQHGCPPLEEVPRKLPMVTKPRLMDYWIDQR